MNLVTEAVRKLALSTIDDMDDNNPDLSEQYEHVQAADSVHDIIDVLAKELGWDLESTFSLFLKAIAGEQAGWSLPEFSA